MSLALYRTYRPGRLSEVVGQEHVTEPLARALSHDRVHHAYLFSGPRGCGKTSTARILARSLNCEQGPTPDPCGVCQSCIDLAPNGPGSLDVIELDAASHGGVEDTRDLRERAMFAPASSRYKIYIVDEAHMVSSAGFNALLKLVEEPPEHVRFIFATTEVDKVLPTIRSRTHNYTFRLVPTRLLQQHLASVCESEGVSADPLALALVARTAGGSVRDSLSILGQLVAGSGPEGLTYEDAATQLGVTDVALVDATIDAIASGQGAQLFTVIDRVVEAGHDPRRFATDLLQRLRDLIVMSAMSLEESSQLLDVPDSDLEAMRAQVQRLSLAELSRAADVVSEGLTALRGATAPRLQLELIAARLLLPAADDSERGFATRLDRLERAMSGRGPASAGAPAATPQMQPPPVEAPPVVEQKPAPAKAPASTSTASGTGRGSVPPPPRRVSDVMPSHQSAETPKVAPAVSPPAADSPPAPSPSAASPAPVSSATSGVSLADIRTMWPAVMEGIASMSRVAWMLFSESVPLSLEDGVLAVGVADAGKVNNARASGHGERLRQVILDVVKADVQVDVVAMGSDTAKAAVGVLVPDAPSMDDADDDGDLSGQSLAMRELGATVIGEIEQA